MRELALANAGNFAQSESGLFVPEGADSLIEVAKKAVIYVVGPWMPTKNSAELLWGSLDKKERRILDQFFKLRNLRDRILLMAGSDANYLSKALGDLAFGKTAYAGETTIYCGLWTAALDDTFAGNTTGEAAYTSYARLSLTNNTTIFAAGTGTTTYSKSWPSDAAKNWPTSTGGSATVTYFGALNGNAGSSADKGMVWASVTSTAIASGDTPQLAQNAVTQTRD
jgi:hypothetical protein